MADTRRATRPRRVKPDTLTAIEQRCVDRWLQGGITQSQICRDLPVPGDTLGAQRGWLSRLLETPKAKAYMAEVDAERSNALVQAHVRAGLDGVRVEDSVSAFALKTMANEQVPMRERIAAARVAAQVAAERLKRLMPQRLEHSGPGGGPVPMELVWAEEIGAQCAQLVEANAVESS